MLGMIHIDPPNLVPVYSPRLMRFYRNIPAHPTYMARRSTVQWRLYERTLCILAATENPKLVVIALYEYRESKTALVRNCSCQSMLVQGPEGTL